MNYVITGLPVAIWLEVKLNAQTSNLFSAILAVGGSEELAKLVPMLIVVLLAVTGSSPRLRSWLELSPRTYLYLGCVSGVAFGCAEGVEYMVSTQNAQINGEVSIFILTKTVFLRLITDPLNHALWAGISGFFLGLAVQRIRRTNRTGVMALLEQSWLILTGLAVAAVLHGVNDFVTANAAVQALVDATSALILLGYALAGDIVEQAVADAPAPQWGSRIAAATRTHLTTQPTAQPHAQPYWGAPAPVPPQPYYPPATAWTTPPAAPAPQAQPVGWTVGQPTMTPTR